MLLPNHNLAEAYQKIDAAAGFHLSRAIELYTGLENLASNHYDAAFGFPSLPLTVRTGVKVTLGGESWK